MDLFKLFLFVMLWDRLHGGLCHTIVGVAAFLLIFDLH